MARTPEQLAEQTTLLIETLHDFCNQDEKTWLETPTSFDDFKKGKISQLIFHKSNLGAPALALDIQQFVDKLHERLDFVGFRAVPNAHEARAALRLQAAKKDELICCDDETISTLLKTIVAHYEKK